MMVIWRILRVIFFCLLIIALIVFFFQNNTVLSAWLQLGYNIGFVNVAPFSLPIYALVLLSFMLGVFIDGCIGLIFWYRSIVLKAKLERISRKNSKSVDKDIKNIYMGPTLDS